jgi:hypothetical protein
MIISGFFFLNSFSYLLVDVKYSSFRIMSIFKLDLLRSRESNLILSTYLYELNVQSIIFMTRIITVIAISLVFKEFL